MMNQTFFCPTEVICGPGVLQQLSTICKDYGETCLFVMDPFFKGKEIETRIINLLEGTKVITYANVTPNPRTDEIDAGANQKVDFIVALGGGSAIDTAKAINVVMTNGGNSWQYTKAANRAPKPMTEPLLPLIAIPTTSGTGTEATRYSVITNSETHEKATIKSDNIFPTKSLVDPELMYSVPRLTTALTGIDAFAHCFEAYIGSKANDFSDMFTLKGIELFADNILNACLDGNNTEARNNMALCSTLGGLSITHSATTLPHAIGQALSGVTDAPHGGSIAVCMSEVIRFTLPQAKEKMAKVACIFDKSLIGQDEDKQAYALPDILDNLFAKMMDKKVTMKSYGLTEDKIEKVADLALTNFNGDVSRHPKLASKEDLIEIITKCM